MFEKDQRNFYNKIEKNEKFQGEQPEMGKFTEFWGGIWEKEEVTPMLPWMDNVKEELKTSINTVKEFTIEEERLIKIAKKRKNWTSPGIDGIQTYWWKKFRTAQKVLKRAFERAEVDNNMIPQWWPAGRTVLIPKTKELGDVKNYRPITCLNTSYKLMTGLIGKYMRDHAMENEIWDEGQLGGVEGVLGTVDQLLIDVCIMEEVRSYHRNLAVAYYDYKKAYDKVHHDWMLRVFNWMGIPKNVTALLILAVQWAIEHQLIDNQTKWYRERWERGHVLESKDAKLVWDFEFHLRKTTTSRRPDLTLEDKQKKTIWICDMACPQERNIETKMNDKRTKYQQLAFEIRERRKEYKVVVVPIIIGCLGGGVDKTIREVRRIFENDELAKQIVGTMQKTVLMDSETTLRKIFSGLIQLEES